MNILDELSLIIRDETQPINKRRMATELRYQVQRLMCSHYNNGQSQFSWLLEKLKEGYYPKKVGRYYCLYNDDDNTYYRIGKKNFQILSTLISMGLLKTQKGGKNE